MPVPTNTQFGGGGEAKPPIPEDVYQCEILDVTLAQKPKYKKPDEKEDMLTFIFVVIEQADAYGRKLYKDMRPIVSPPKGDHSASNLYDFLSAIAGRALTEDECREITAERINSLIGQQVRLTVKVTEKGKNKIDGAMKIKAKLPAFTIAHTEEETA